MNCETNSGSEYLPPGHQYTARFQLSVAWIYNIFRIYRAKRTQPEVDNTESQKYILFKLKALSTGTSKSVRKSTKENISVHCEKYIFLIW